MTAKAVAQIKKPRLKLSGGHIYFSRDYKDIQGLWISSTGNVYFVIDGKGYHMKRV
jgi:hypothetical protein